MGRSKAVDFELAVMRMFQHEWQLQHQAGMPQRIAIVDDRPEEQYLYPEFLLARRLIQKHGIEAVIADGRQLRYEHGQLLTEGQPIDLVYNRLVDFSLTIPSTALCVRPISTTLSSSPPIRACTRSTQISAI